MTDGRRSLFWMYWWLEQRIAPGLRYSQMAYEDVLRSVVADGVRWLDLGCGHRMLPEFRSASEEELVRQAGSVAGLDLSRSQLARNRTVRWRVLGSGGGLPFRENSFDLITANMVLEHLDDPAACFAEVKRTLRPGGRFLFHTPNAHGYGPRLAGFLPDRMKRALIRLFEGRTEDDVFPTRYRANTIGVIRRLAHEAGLGVARLEAVRSVAQTASVPPLALLELLWLRQLARPRMESHRPIILALLQKPPETTSSSPMASSAQAEDRSAPRGGDRESGGSP